MFLWTTPLGLRTFGQSWTLLKTWRFLRISDSITFDGLG
jgi:hypothetical protein